MKILIVAPLLPHPGALNAGALVVYEQLVVLATRHAITLATFAGPDPGERAALVELRASGLTVHAVWRNPPRGRRRWTHRVRLLLTWLRTSHPLPVLEFSEPAMQRLLDRLMREGAYDLVQVEYSMMTGYRYAVGTPVLLIDHEVFTVPAAAVYRVGGHGPSWPLSLDDERRWRHYLPTAWSRFDRIQVFTDEDAAVLLALAPHLRERVRVNPFGIALPPQPDPALEEEGLVLFVGGFVHPPNVDAARWLADAIMPALRQRVPDARLAIVGADPSGMVLALADPVAGIAVLGRVPTIEPYLARAAVVVAPVRTGGGMRRKVLHALAMGKAVVTTTRGTAGLGADVPVIVADDAPGIAHALAALLENRPARRALGQRGRAFVAAAHNHAAYVARLERTQLEALASPGGAHTAAAEIE